MIRTVADLVAELQRLDQSLPVVLYDEKHDEFSSLRITTEYYGKDLCNDERPSWYIEAKPEDENAKRLAWIF